MTVGQATRVLLVEDDPDHADLIQMALKEAVPDAEVTWIDHGTRALRHLERCAQQQRSPDVVFLDLKLPGHGGIEVLQRLRAQPDLATLPVIVLTSSRAAEDRQAAEAAGADRFLVKVFPMARLGDTLRAALVGLGARSAPGPESCP